MIVYIEGHPEDQWMAHALDEPGCIWIAPNHDQLLSNGPEAVKRFRDWLTRNGEPKTRLSPDEMLQFSLVHEIPQLGLPGATVALFSPDYNPISKEDIATVIRRLGYARRELLELVTSLPGEAMDWLPPDGKRTLRQNLEHVGNCQGWYLSRLLGINNLQRLLLGSAPQDTLEKLNWMQENTVRILLDWPPTLYGGVYRAEKPRENWTPRKMLRRILEHELEHIWVIRRTITPPKEMTGTYLRKIGPSNS